ncbi:MAG: hypothetical protein ACYCVD_14065 [Desulfitobacteriaceae bacterium]
MYLYTEEIQAAKARIRIDVQSEQPVTQLLEDTNFLNYRLAGVQVFQDVTREKPDLFWDQTKPVKNIRSEDGSVTIEGDWFEGEIQKIIVSLMAKHMLEQDLYLFHASAVRYRGKTIMFMGGEGNSGKTMSQIEACKRGGQIISTETIVTDPEGHVVMGSKNVFLRVRAKGTERIDKPNQDEGVAKFFNKTPEFELYTGEASIDIVVLPDIDGNYSTLVGEMSTQEKQYQTFHCLCDYFGMHLLLAPGLPMPLFDTENLRAKRTTFIARFTSERPYLFIRGKDPQVIMDELDRLLDRGEK